RVDRGAPLPPGEEEPAAEEQVLATVATGPLIAAIVLESGWLILILAGLVAGIAVAPGTVSRVLGGGGFVWSVSLVTFLWRRFNQQYRLTVAEGPDGLHLRGGLVALTAEVIRPGRVQAVRLVEPFLWRRLGWCRLEVDLAGRQRRKGESETTGRALRALLPVGSRALGLELLDHVLPGAPQPVLRAPRRVRFKSPLRYRYLAWGRSET